MDSLKELEKNIEEQVDFIKEVESVSYQPNEREIVGMLLIPLPKNLIKSNRRIKNVQKKSTTWRNSSSTESS